MRKVYLGVLLLFLASNIALGQEVRISENDLPKVVRESIAKFFPEKKISSVVKDTDDFKTKYEVSFDDYTEAEFRGNGQLTEVKNRQGIADNVVPARVKSFVDKNYANSKIVKWEKNKNKQEVKLDNGLELEFSANGKFLRIDN